MEKNCLVTSSLIESVKWALKSPDSIIKPERGGDGKLTWREKGLKDLKNTLARIWTDPTPEIQHGIKFEKKVYETLRRGQYGVGSDYFQRVCKEIKGFDFQVKQGIPAKIAGENCYLYGKYDAVHKPNSYIKDLKTTAKFKHDKYLKSVQHKFYCYIAGEGFDWFDYVIAEWDKYPKIKNVYIERYVVEDRAKLEREVFVEVEDCFEGIKDFGLWDLYRDKYCLY
jgi:hypothetical protein